MSDDIEAKSDTDTSNVDESDNNASFVKKVKSRVSGFIPTSFSKWFGNANSSTIRHRNEVDDDEDDMFKLEPPAKRAKLPSANHINKNFLSSTALQNNLNFLSTPIGHETSSRGPSRDLGNCDSDSGESTSGYSSMPRIGSKEQVSDFTEQVAGPSKEVTKRKARLFNNSTSITERTLFNDTSSNSSRAQNESLSSRRPSFNASVFGSSNFLDRTLSTRRIVNSPFYSGRTTYGGAAAFNKNLLKTQEKDKNTHHHNVEPKIFNPNKSTTLSKTAKRILDTLEQYTSPVQDVKRIPNPLGGDKGTPRSSYYLNKYAAANPYAPREHPRPIPKVELQVPSMTNLLKMKLKERLQDSTTAVRQLAADSKCQLNKEQYKLNTDESSESAQHGGKRQNKMKTKVVNLRQKANKPQGIFTHVPIEEVKLPNVQLPITTLPSFNFTVPAMKPATKVVEEKRVANGIIRSEEPVKKAKDKEVVDCDTTKKEIVSKAEEKAISTYPTIPLKKPKTEFRFSEPVILKENIISIKGINNFIFSKPLVRKQNGLNNQCIENFNFNGDSVKLLKKRLPTNDTVDTSIVVSPAKNLIDNGSILDVLCKFKNEPSATSKGGESWECSNCWIRNLSDKKKCAACEAPKPIKKSDGDNKKKPVSNFGDDFKMKLSQWECSVCMVRNDSSRLECVACTTPKSKPAAAATANSTSTSAPKLGFGNEFKLGSSQWECSVCMVRNKNDVQVCASCTTPRSVKPAEVQKSSPKVIMAEKKSTTWECPTCMIRNNEDKLKCACCETAKPGSNNSVIKMSNKNEHTCIMIHGDSVKTFRTSDSGKKDADWECPSCMVRNASEKNQCVCCETPKPGGGSVKTTPTKIETPKFGFGINNGQINGHGFTFGIPASSEKSSGFSSSPLSSIPKPSTENTSATFSFGIPQPNGAKPETKIDIAKTTTESIATPTFTFGAIKTNSEAVKPIETSEKPAEILKTASLNTNAAKPTSSQFNFGSNLTTAKDKLPTFSSGTLNSGGDTASVKPSLFNFASNSTTTTPQKLESVAPSVMPASTSIGTLFAAKDKGETKAPMFSFSGSDKPLFGGAASATTNATTNATFNFSATPPVAAPAFNMTETQKPTTPSLFGSAAAAATEVKSIFGSPAETNNKSSVGGSGFGTLPTNNVMPTFGNSSSLATNFGSGITGNSAPMTNNVVKSVVNEPQKPFAFGATAFNANSENSKSEWKPTTNGVFSFGSKNAAANLNSQSAPMPAPPASGFNFGAPNVEAQPSGFNFGSSAPVPTFNFTGGAPMTFTAQGNADAKPTNRVIRKALRRTQR